MGSLDEVPGGTAPPRDDQLSVGRPSPVSPDPGNAGQEVPRHDQRGAPRLFQPEHRAMAEPAASAPSPAEQAQIGGQAARWASALGPWLGDLTRRLRPRREPAPLVEDAGPYLRGSRAEREGAGGWMLALERAMFLAVVLGGTLGGVLAASRLAPSPSGTAGLVQVDQVAAQLDQGRPAAAGSPAPLVALSPAIRSPSPSAAPTGGATPGPAAGQRMRVAHTDGQGVVLRASPRMDDRTPRGFSEGQTVTVLERSGPDWARVRGGDGQEGWVPARYLEQAP